MQLQLLKEKRLQPSSATWELLEKSNWLPVFHTLLLMEQQKPLSYGQCTHQISEMVTKIVENSIPTSEGYATLVCGHIITEIVCELNKKKPVYKFEVEPVVRKEQNSRYNKKADYSIFKIWNRKTYIMIEVKLSVSNPLKASDKNSLAQLFLEMIYCCDQENTTQMLCILTDGFTWHCIATDMSRPDLPINFKQYSLITLNKQDNGFVNVCSTIINYVQTITN